MKKPYKLSILKTDETNGVLAQVPNISSVYRIEVADFYGNITKVSIPVKYGTSPAIVAQEPIISKYFVKAANESSFEKENMSVFFSCRYFL